MRMNSRIFPSAMAKDSSGGPSTPSSSSDTSSPRARRSARDFLRSSWAACCAFQRPYLGRAARRQRATPTARQHTHRAVRGGRGAETLTQGTAGSLSSWTPCARSCRAPWAAAAPARGPRRCATSSLGFPAGSPATAWGLERSWRVCSPLALFPTCWMFRRNASDVAESKVLTSGDMSDSVAVAFVALCV